MRFIWTGSSSLSKAILQSQKILTSNILVRCLFSAERLGLVKYEKARQKLEFNIDHAIFKEELQTKLQSADEFNYIQLEFSLKPLIHIIKNSETDVNILRDTLKLLAKKQMEYKGAKFIFGPTIMRAFYFNNMPNAALQFFEDQHLKQFFVQYASQEVLLDLLYKHGRYDDIIRIYENLRRFGHLRHSKPINSLIFATFYRLNTLDAMQQACSMFCQITENDVKLYRRNQLFVAGLAVKQQRPQLALKMLEATPTCDMTRQIRLLAWAQLKQFKKFFEILRTMIIRHENEENFNPKISTEVLNNLEENIKQSQRNELINEFNAIRKNIQSLELTTNETFDNMICETIE